MRRILATGAEGLTGTRPLCCVGPSPLPFFVCPLSPELKRDLKKLKTAYDWVRCQIGEPTNAEPVVVFIPGCWDLFHVGHLNVIKRAAALGDYLVVGIATSKHMQALWAAKGDEIIPFDQRRSIIGGLRYVDATIPYEMDDFSILDKYDVTIWAVGSEHGTYEFEERVDRELERRGIIRVILPRTPGVSTTMIKEKIMGRGPEGEKP